jgi:Putative peptidoglycan binding domain
LREALARSDHDFVVNEPRPRRQTPRVGIGDILFGCLRLAYRAAAYPNRVAAALLILVLIAIAINALVLQRSPHPAPLFGKTLPVQATPVPTPPVNQAPWATEKQDAASIEPEGQKTGRDPIAQLLKGNVQHPAPPASLRKHPDPDATGIETKPSRDAISQFLKATAQPTPAETSSNKTVLAAQRALVKLGFVLKPDGVNGAATKQAVEQFERDRGLPVKGELTPKVLRELAQQSGQPIE